MNIKSIKFLDKNIGNIICRILGAFSNPISQKKTKKILIIQLWGVGESILTLPAVYALIDKFPESKIDILVTVGADANKILAAEAEARGCVVQKFNNPYSAGRYVRPLVKKGALILAKGSQNKIFTEEAVKILLANPADTSKLVRQSAYWDRRKAKALKGLV